MRLALAARCQGLDALAAGEPIPGLGPVLLRRLRRAAARWLRWRPTGAPDPVGERLRRADAHPGVELGELVRALRQRAAILAAWPAWLKRDGDRLMLDPGYRFLQVHRLPSPAELATPALRRWLLAFSVTRGYVRVAGRATANRLLLVAARARRHARTGARRWRRQVHVPFDLPAGTLRAFCRPRTYSP